jgi:tetratricopeptide (TPR) repeat protein
MPSSKRSGSGFGKRDHLHTINKDKHKEKEGRAALLLQQGENIAAENILRNLIAENTKNHDTYFRLAMLCGMKGRIGEMEEMLQSAIQIKPNFSSALFNLGVIFQNRGQLEKAIDFYRVAIKNDVTNLSAISNLGTLLHKQGQIEEAIEFFRRGLEQNPTHLECLYNLGMALQESEKYSEAVDLYRAVLVKSPGNPDVCGNLGRIFYYLRQLETAKVYFEQAILASDKHEVANWSYAHLLLLQGDYAKGLQLYEYRLKSPELFKLVVSSPPSTLLWNGSNHYNGQEIIFICEQGLGDTIQFIRYVKYLENSDYNVSICAPTKLHNLITASHLCKTIYSPEEISNKVDCLWLPLMSLMRILQVNPGNVLLSEPYVSCSQELFQEWRKKIDCEEKCVIGLNWQGNPDTEKSSPDLRGRSISLDAYSSISQVPNTKFVSLQKGVGSEQVPNCSFKYKFVNCQQEIDDTWDFLDACAIMMNCSLIITSDTVVAHLAAALGRPTWLLLHADSEWRWGLEGDTTFWYPSMRLFRQRERGNWNEVMIRVALELDKFLSDKKHLVFQEP